VANDFRRRLKEFTSGAKPHHCLVESIDIASPAPILDEGVLLIDTPGLDDPERFRVSLTEKTVEDVDAILFLTKSGESYGQGDKDFLLSLLRKGTVKQLIVVITQLDVTYQQHLDNAEANDEDPEPLSLRIERERRRLAKELAATLVELSEDDSPAMRRYREQLGDVEIAFTSAKLHRDWKAGKSTLCAVDPADPGGVERLTNQLLRMLSTESRLAIAAQNIASGSRMALLDLQSVLDTKLLAIRDIEDREVAEQKLRSFRDQLGEASKRFETSVGEQVALLNERLVDRRMQHAALVETIVLLAERELGESESSDLQLSWQARRFRHWGTLVNLQLGIANRIFPKVQVMLSEYTQAFAAFANGFEVQLQALSSDGSRISDSLELGTTLPFDVTTKLKESLERSLRRAQDLIAEEEQRVISLLDNFVSDEVFNRIEDARRKVADVGGTGTTINQAAEVQRFYRDLKRLLAEALLEHLKARSQSFGDFLVLEAQGAPRDAVAELRVLLEQATDNIRAAAEALVAGQKEAIETLVAAIQAGHQDVLTQAEQLLQIGTEQTDTSSKVGDLPVPEPEVSTSVVVETVATIVEPMAVTTVPSMVTPIDTSEPVNAATRSLELTRLGADGDWVDHVQQEATAVVHRMRLREGSTGWPVEKVFEARFLKGALRVQLVDPYLACPHQIRNLNDLLLHIAETLHPKEIEVVTGSAPSQRSELQERAIERAAEDLFANYGVALTLRRETGLHDRFLFLDHGVMFKLGRGLDIYKPAVGLAEHRSANRKVRATDIDVFCPMGHALLNGGNDRA
ncbi:MAG: dynamin family protein, partial [Planctomycetes bacterium]|nr:dynamin family protein [Planctomycetota bacterium]